MILNLFGVGGRLKLYGGKLYVLWAVSLQQADGNGLGFHFTDWVLITFINEKLRGLANLYYLIMRKLYIIAN